MQSRQDGSQRRRTTAASLKGTTLAFLAEALPAGWVSQALSSDKETGAGGDILVISPRGRCHFLFVHAPADRWWDGGPRSVPAEKFSAAQARMAQQLRAAGHCTRAIRGAEDLARALKAWGCPLRRPVRFAGAKSAGGLPRSAGRPPRGLLRLPAWRGPDHD